MSSRSRSAALAAVVAGLLLTSAAPSRVLRVCADPNNLPFSSREENGFENRIADLVGQDLGARVRYTWWPERRGFLRHTIKAGHCDLVLGIPATSEQLLTTPPYYTSSYVFLTRRHDSLRLNSLDDPRLRSLRIGIHFIGDDYQNTPPAQALARRGIIRNVTGYSIYGDYATPNPPSTLVAAVADSDIDVAIIWGSFAGYFGSQRKVPLDWRVVAPIADSARTPFRFAIAAGVRREDTALYREVTHALSYSRGEIARILRDYHIPQVAEPGS
jgi:mxaJ protein